MNSSGMKRGLAATAISALAVTGLPFLATSASATPIADTFVNPEAVALYSATATNISDKNDGTNETASLVAGAGADVTSVLFQYQATSTLTDWNDVPGGAVARNADGVFALDWANVPADVTNIRAVADTGEIATSGADSILDTAANTVELASEGALGVFQSPYAAADDVDGTAGADGKDGDYIIATGTTSGATTAVTVTDASHSTGGTTGSINSVDADGAQGAGTTGAFAGILDIRTYPYSVGAEANQIALRAATNNTDDAEGSTLYVQQIASITATPATQEVSNPANSVITLKVVDQNGEPIANAQVGRYVPDDASDTDTDPQSETEIGYTNAKGEFVDDTRTTAGTFYYYVNVDDNNGLDANDKTTSAVVTTYTPQLASVDIVNERNRSSLDLDELLDSDDFSIETRDQRGNLIDETLAGPDIQYRWVVDPSAPNTEAQTSNWVDVDDAAGGEFAVPGLTDADWQRGDNPVTSNTVEFPGHTVASGDLPNGSYTIEARRPNSNGTGLTNATPETFTGSESEITFDEGTEANVPVEGDTVLTGNLALIQGGADLAGREIRLSFSAREDARFVDSASTDASADGLTAVTYTDANGNFSVTVDDLAGPSNVPNNPETATVVAKAYEAKDDTTVLKGDNGADDPAASNAAANAEQAIDVNFQDAPEVGRVEIDDAVLDDYSWWNNGQAAPGSPVSLEVVVYGTDNDANPDNDPVLQDYPVQVSVDKGFLSPFADDEEELTLAAGHDDEGDLWGFFEDLGADEQVSTGDDAMAGIVAAMEDDADFADDGRAEMTVTVKAGDVTETVDLDFDVRNFLNLQDVSLERAAGEPMGDVVVGDTVDFQLYAEDQFGNLVGDHAADISDDSTVAEVTTDGDFGATETDFATDQPGIRATSPAETVQTLFARLGSQEVLVDDADADDAPEYDDSVTVTEASEPINWVGGNEDPRNPELVLVGKNNGGNPDRLKADAIDAAEGATARLFRKVRDGVWKKVGQKVLNAKGNARFKVADKNGKKLTTYRVKLSPTERTTKDRSTFEVR